MTNRTTILLLALLAPLAWAGLLLYTRFVPPGTLLAFATLFVILCVALTATLTPLIYTIGHKLLSLPLYQAGLHRALRQSALFSLAVVLNLMLRALHGWNVLTAIVICLAAFVVEVLSLSGK